MFNPHRFAATLLAALCAAALLSACGGSSNDGGSTSSGGTTATSKQGAAARAVAPYLEKPSRLADLPPLDQAPPKDKTIYYIGTGGGSASDIAAGVAAATRALGWTFKTLSYNVANLGSGNSAYLTAVNSGADGIISTGLPAAAIRQGLDAASSKDVQVVLINPSEPSDAEGFAQVGNVGVSAPLFSKVNALGIAADAEREGVTPHVGVVSSSGIPALTLFTNAVVDGLKQDCEECDVQQIDVPAADLVSGQASKSVISFIQRNPDTNYVNVAIGSFEGGMRAALDSAGLDKVKIAGIEATAAQNQEIASGASLFWVQMPHAYNAWTAVDALARSFTGGDAEIHNRQPMPVWLVEKSNLGFDPRALPEYPTDYPAQYKRLWKVG